MNTSALELKGFSVDAYFQPYHVNLSRGARPPHRPPNSELSGELLTRPHGRTDDIEGFFSARSMDEHFIMLEWHLELAHQLHDHAQAHTAINLHNSIIQEESNRQRFISMISQCSVPITFEFTETHPMPAREVANPLLREIRRSGHQTALDDFGTGISGMSLLTDFDFDVIKLDRSLTFDIEHRLEKKKMLALILKMLEVLGRDHVVEGIEDVAVYDFLLEIGYAQFQGFLFDQPQPVQHFLTANSDAPRGEHDE